MFGLIMENFNLTTHTFQSGRKEVHLKLHNKEKDYCVLMKQRTTYLRHAETKWRKAQSYSHGLTSIEHYLR